MDRRSLDHALGEEVAELHRVSGGDLNDAYRARLASGTDVFVKTSTTAAPGAFAAEAAGLRWLAGARALRVPGVIAAGEDFLALEWIEAGGRPDDEGFGASLAQLHAAGAPAHGWTPDPPLRIGPIALDAAPAPRFADVLTEQRWRPLARRAAVAGSLDRGVLSALDRLCDRAAELLPDVPPARLHGDLWSGNVMATADGRVVLVDPAAHGGDPEVDLAMLMLFGSPSARMLAAYDDVLPRPDGHADRVALHQLTPLLVHAVLFGGGYGARAEAIITEYAGRH